MNFHNINKIYKSDWKRIVKNPIAIIILLGICVIPSLYAWVNIHACWDVYNNTKAIPVAVVNNDQDAYMKGKKINVGSDVVNQLKKNNNIKWVFTNSRDANLGLIDSTYYAMIEIPSDFSSKFLTVMTDNPQKPQIRYKADAKANPVASKITATANSTLIEQISTEFIHSVNKTAFSSLNTVGQDASKNKGNILKVKDFVININRNMNLISNSLQSVSYNSDNVNAFLGSISDTMPMIQSGLESVGENNSHNEDIVESMQKSMKESNQNMDLNLRAIQIGNKKIQELFSSLNDSVTSANSSKINTALPAMSAQLDSMNRSIDATIDYLKQCESYDFNSDIDRAIKKLTDLKTNLTNLRKTLVDAQEQLKKLSGSLDELYSYLEKEIPELEKKLDTIGTSLNETIAQLEQLNQTLQNPTITQLIESLKAIQTADLKSKILAVLETIKDSRPTVEAAIQSLDETITMAIKDIDTANRKIDDTIIFLQSSKSSNVVKKQQINKMIEYLQNTKPYIIDEQNQLANIRNQLNSVNGITNATANIVNKDSNQITQQINSAIQLYHSNVKYHLENIQNNLITSIKDSSKLINNAQSLSEQITTMVKTAQKGSGLTSEIADKLKGKLEQFKDVISSLASKFEQVDNKNITEIISILQSDPQFMGNYISNPFDIKRESINQIPNYGSGMAPIYSTLALWVGCLILNSILSTKPAHFDGIEQITIRERHFGKMLFFTTIAIIQGIVIAIGDIWILKIYVVSPALFIFFVVLSSIVFCIINFTLVSTLGNVGKALAIIYLILQVAGSGGSYPIQVDPLIFRILQPLFPFTYTLSGLREAIAGPLSSTVIVDVIALTIFSIAFLVGGYLNVKPLNDIIHRFEHNFKKSGLGE